MAEYLARVTWENVKNYRTEIDPRIPSGTSPGQLPLTDQYGSNQPILNKLKYGDGLWLFTAPVFGKGKKRRTLPPSVLGRIAITHKWGWPEARMEPVSGAPDGTANERKTEVLAVSKFKFWLCGEPSEPLPIHNAFPLLKSLTFEGRNPQIDPECKGCNPHYVPVNGPFGHLMQHFESIRKLTDESAVRLQKLHNHVRNRYTLFLSHRQDESGSLVRLVAENLKYDTLCWWDVQALPQSRQYTDTLLQDMLNDGIRQAGWFVAFLTKGYAATRWTDDEWKEAQKLWKAAGLARKPKILPVILGGERREGMGRQQPIRVAAGMTERARAEAITAAIRNRLGVVTG